MMRALLILISALGVTVFVALGVWQVQRLGWKTELIADVTARVAAPPLTPGAEGAPEYTRVTLSGAYAPEQVLVKAVTERGAGFWVMAVMDTGAYRVWINRGFVADGVTPPAPPVTETVTGLLRLSQPGGGFLRENDPAAGRWFSRDLAGMDAARGIDTVDWFVDAQTGGPLPEPGLTVVSFNNHHLQYAATWFVLALLLAGAAWWNLGRRVQTP